MDILDDSTAILNSSVSNSCYGMLGGKLVLLVQQRALSLATARFQSASTSVTRECWLTIPFGVYFTKSLLCYIKLWRIPRESISDNCVFLTRILTKFSLLKFPLELDISVEYIIHRPSLSWAKFYVDDID